MRKISSLSLSIILSSLVSSAQNNSTDAKTRMESWEHHVKLKKESIFKDLVWRAVGPSFSGGRIESIAVHHSQPYTIYVGAGAGNIWKTVNNGITWEPIFENESTFAIGEVAIAPSDPNIIWVGTGEVLMARSSYAGTGIFKSTDAGKTWKKEPFLIQDDLGETKRWPLGSTISGDTAGVVYLAHNPEDYLQAKYYFTQSSDKGKTWSKGVAITKYMKYSDPALYVQMTSVGDRIAFSYMETLGKWTKGEIENHVAVSQDQGKTWAAEPLGNYYNGVMLFSALSGSPDGSRLLYNTAIRMTKNGNSRSFLVVQEYSGRTFPKADPAVIRQLIKQLGHKEYGVRQGASEKLATMGISARDELVKATKDKDLEVVTRAERLLEQLFPECLKLQPSVNK